MTLSAIAAQIETYEPFMRYGLLGVIIGWVLLKVDKRLDSIEKAIQGNSHKITGLNRVLLLEMLSRDNLSIQTKVLAREELAKAGGQPPE